MSKVPYLASMLAPILLLTPTLHSQRPAPPAPRSIPSRTIHDRQAHLKLTLPGDWPTSTRDRILSTFREEARTAPPGTRLRLVAAMPRNPFPFSSFSGAHLYLSILPHVAGSECAPSTPPVAEPVLTIGGLPAIHTQIEYGASCSQFRDSIYTVARKHACLRFDLSMNNFCGAAAGVPDPTPAQVRAVQQQLEAILHTVVFNR